MAIVGLISCVSRKRAFATEAWCLYDSPLFAKARQYVEKLCDRWYILSAKYGLITPHQIIEPYEETLKTKPRMAREGWAIKVWEQLRPLLTQGDHVVVLAGVRYREFLVPLIVEHGCTVDVPLEGKSIGRQLQSLSQYLQRPTRDKDVERLYAILQELEEGLHGKRLMSECIGMQDWPKSGIYFFFEPGETRSSKSSPRIVRVGTHGVSRGSKATLWNRLRTHRGTADGLGNHRGSIFRLHVGAALARRDQSLAVPSWGIGQIASADVRRQEEYLERAVSKHINSMSVLWLAVEDEPSPASDRAYLERNLIGLLVGRDGPADNPSSNWLGLFSPNKRIGKSGMWNLNFLEHPYSNEFFDVFNEYVSITLHKKSRPACSIAPHDWHLRERQKTPHNQLSLFGDDTWAN